MKLASPLLEELVLSSRGLILIRSSVRFDIFTLFLFRSSNPEDRRVTPENVNGRKKFKVVYVVLESQYQSSMTVACKRINAGQVFEVTYVVFDNCASVTSSFIFRRMFVWSPLAIC